MRITLQAWWCGNCNNRNDAENRKCWNCSANKIEKHAQVHSSDRAVVYYNPRTGDHRTPARSDQPMPEVYAKQGFERMEIMSMSAYEKQTGSVHEASNFNAGNEITPLKEPEPKAPKELIDSIVDDMRQACASGPWTINGERL